jgi:hypothetical protein
LGIRRFLAPPRAAAGEAERLEWFRNVEAMVLVAGIVAVSASVIYLPLSVSVILGLIVLRTTQRVVVLTRRARVARSQGSGRSSPGH